MNTFDALASVAVGLVLSRVQYAISSIYAPVQWNGFGAITDVVNMSARAPMAYRVLVPIMISWFPPKFRRAAYDLMVTTLCMLMMLTLTGAFGLKVAVICALILVTTMRYDYWCWPIEVAALAGAASGIPYLAAPWAVFMIFSRETLPLVPITWMAYGGSFVGGIALSLTMVMRYVVKRSVGHRDLYCDRFMERNWNELMSWVKSPHLTDDMAITIVVSLATVFVCFQMGDTKFIPWMILLASGWFLAVAKETRVFSACCVPIALWIAGR